MLPNYLGTCPPQGRGKHRQLWWKPARPLRVSSSWRALPDCPAVANRCMGDVLNQWCTRARPQHSDGTSRCAERTDRYVIQKAYDRIFIARSFDPIRRTENLQHSHRTRHPAFSFPEVNIHEIACRTGAKAQKLGNELSGCAVAAPTAWFRHCVRAFDQGHRRVSRIRRRLLSRLATPRKYPLGCHCTSRLLAQYAMSVD